MATATTVDRITLLSISPCIDGYSSTGEMVVTSDWTNVVDMVASRDKTATVAERVV